MARVIPSMELFMVGAYLQLVEGCDYVAYHSELPSRKHFWIDAVGRNEARQKVYHVDFADKFDSYEPDMRPDTMVKKLVKRYVDVHRYGVAMDYEPDRVRCQIWLPRPAPGRVAEALPKVVERLRERHGIPLEIIEPGEVARRIPAVVERVVKLSFDYDNLFIRALLVAQKRLDYQAGAPMDEEHIQAMYRFPRSIPSAFDIPKFIYQCLTSDEVVHWLDFYSPTFDDLAAWLPEYEPSGNLGELRQALAERGEADESMLDYDFDELTETSFITHRYSARDLAELTRLVLHDIEAIRAGAEDHALLHPFAVEIDLMLPFLSRVRGGSDPGYIEREILRYGGDRDQMLAHFAEYHPDKYPYRATLRVDFSELGSGEPPPPYRGRAMRVPIDQPELSDTVAAAVSINYAPDFAGYFVLMMNRLAAHLSF